MKTIIKTSIEGNKVIEVAETIEYVHSLLEAKGNYILLNKVNHERIQSPISIRKTTIKLVREQ